MSDSGEIGDSGCTPVVPVKRRTGSALSGWYKGMPGPNPHGRPKSARFIDGLRRALGEPVSEDDPRTKLEAIIDTLISKAIGGCPKCLALIGQHCDPLKLRQSIKAGNVNILSLNGTPSREEIDEASATYRLAGVLSDAGMCQSAIEGIVRRFVSEGQPITARAGNAAIDEMMQGEMIPRRAVGGLKNDE